MQVRPTVVRMKRPRVKVGREDILECFVVEALWFAVGKSLKSSIYITEIDAVYAR